MQIKKNNDTTLVADYTYDGLGRKIEKVDTVAGKTFRYYYDDQRIVLEEQTSQGSTAYRWFVYGNYIDEALMFEWQIGEQNTRFYFGHDHLFSPVVMFTNTGTVMERYEYDAYGKVRVMLSNYVIINYSLLGNTTFFTGRELDTLDNGSLKIMYYRARYYTPQTGRFLQRDPLGIDPAGIEENPFAVLSQYNDGVSLYQYVSSNSVNNRDPSGLKQTRFSRVTECGCRKGRCGPDVTTEFYKMLGLVSERLKEEFKKPGRKEQICGNGFFDTGGVYTGHGWDAFYEAGLPQRTEEELRWPSREPEVCSKTVSFKGNCVKVWELNYYLWGHINRKCQTSSARFHFWTNFYTTYKGFTSPEDPHCKRSFAEVGYSGNTVDKSCHLDSCCETKDAPVWNITIWPTVGDVRFGDPKED